MASPYGPIRLIVNPHAGRGAVAQHLPELLEVLAERGLDHDVVETGGPGDATRAATAALEDGVRYLLAVGGDGTVHEVVNGMFDLSDPEAPTPRAPDAVLGVSASGSGCDFVRTFGLDRKASVLGRHLAGGDSMDVDVGLVSLTGPDGAPTTRLFANIAEVGWGAEVVARAARLPRWLGRARYLLGAYAAIRTVDRQEADVALAHTTARDELVNLVVANGQFFGGGMWVAPRALPSDGRFNVQLYTGPRSQVFQLTRKIYKGEHLPHPQIREYQSGSVEIAPERPMPVEADGELLGTTPARFSLLPLALRLKV